MYSERFKRGGGLVCQRSSAERFQVASRLAARYRGRLGEVVPTRANGETSAKGLSLRPGEERGDAASQGGDRRRVAVVRLQHNIAAAELSRTKGVSGQAVASVTPHSDPHRQQDLGSIGT